VSWFYVVFLMFPLFQDCMFLISPSVFFKVDIMIQQLTYFAIIPCVPDGTMTSMTMMLKCSSM